MQKDLCAEDKNMQERNERRQDEWKTVCVHGLGKLILFKRIFR